LRQEFPDEVELRARPASSKRPERRFEIGDRRSVIKTVQDCSGLGAIPHFDFSVWWL